MNSLYFRSCANRLPDIRAYISEMSPFGFALGDCKITPRATELFEHAKRRRIPIFIDSGAFSELGKGRKKPKAITPEEWVEKLEQMVELARILGNCAYIMAPDKCGSQSGTIERIFRYRDYIYEILDHGSQVIFGLQGGEMNRVALWHYLVQELGLEQVLDERRWQIIPGIPMVGGATKLPQLQAFLHAVDPQSIHLLGLGQPGLMKNSLPSQVFHWIEQEQRAGRLRRDAVVYHDSCWIRKHIGKGGDKGPVCLRGWQRVSYAMGEEKRRIQEQLEGEEILDLSRLYRPEPYDPEIPPPEEIRDSLFIPHTARKEAIRAVLRKPDAKLLRRYYEEDPPVVLYLVSCTKEKWGEEDPGAAFPAQEIYTKSRLFKKARRYAELKVEQSPNPYSLWAILSAKYGYIEPQEHICHYDDRVKDLEDKVGWADGVIENIERIRPRPQEIVFLTGADYRNAGGLVKKLQSLGYEIEEPYVGKRAIGLIEKWLQREIDDMEPRNKNTQYTFGW